MKTAITASFRSNRCLIRHKQVADTPEERVRQNLLQKMVGEWGFPKGLIAVEKKIGGRRFDLVCYTKEMTPLLLVECKAEEIDEAAIAQAFGYNERVAAPFICLASQTALQLFWHEGGKIHSLPFLPTFQELYDLFLRG